MSQVRDLTSILEARRKASRKDVLSWLGDQHTKANWAGKCLSPIPMEAHGRKATKQTGKEVVVSHDTDCSQVGTHINVVPCRKCAECGKARRKYWMARIYKEMGSTPGRIWFVTLTKDYYGHAYDKRAARRRFTNTIAKRRAVLADEYEASGFTDAAQRKRDEPVPSQSFDLLTTASQDRLVYSEFYADVQKMLKRLRKKGHTFRYVAVLELHSYKLKGLAHCHMLLHETAKPVRKKAIRKEWPFGFTHAELVSTEEVITYIVKMASYLSKSFVKIHASIAYGKKHETHPPIEDKSGLT